MIHFFTMASLTELYHIFFNLRKSTSVEKLNKKAKNFDFTFKRKI